MGSLVPYVNSDGIDTTSGATEGIPDIYEKIMFSRVTWPSGWYGLLKTDPLAYLKDFEGNLGSLYINNPSINDVDLDGVPDEIEKAMYNDNLSKIDDSFADTDDDGVLDMVEFLIHGNLDVIVNGNVSLSEDHDSDGIVDIAEALLYGSADKFVMTSFIR